MKFSLKVEATLEMVALTVVPRKVGLDVLPSSLFLTVFAKAQMILPFSIFVK